MTFGFSLLFSEIMKQGHQLRENGGVVGYLRREKMWNKWESEWTRKKIELFGNIQSTLEMADYDFKVRVVKYFRI